MRAPLHARRAAPSLLCAPSLPRALSLLCALALLACGEPPQTRVRVPLWVAGAAPAAPPAEGPALTRAALAFGPLYLCAGEQAGDLCGAARLEWLDAALVDALDPAPVEVGALAGLSGVARSWMYDLGVSSQLDRDAPYLLDAARALGGSARLEGEWRAGGAPAARFEALLTVTPGEGTERGVPQVRKGVSERFERDVRPGDALTARFDPAALTAGLTARALVEGAECVGEEPEEPAPEEPAPEELTPEELTPEEQLARCGGVWRVRPGSVAARQLTLNLTNNARPRFEWSRAPSLP